MKMNDATLVDGIFEGRYSPMSKASVMRSLVKNVTKTTTSEMKRLGCRKWKLVLSIFAWVVQLLKFKPRYTWGIVKSSEKWSYQRFVHAAYVK